MVPFALTSNEVGEIENPPTCTSTPIGVDAFILGIEKLNCWVFSMAKGSPKNIRPTLPILVKSTS